MEKKATRRYAAGLAAVVTAAVGLIAGTGLVAGNANAQGSGAFIGSLWEVSDISASIYAQVFY